MHLVRTFRPLSLPFNEKFLVNIIPFDINIFQELISPREATLHASAFTLHWLSNRREGIKGRGGEGGRKGSLSRGSHENCSKS